MKKGFDYPTCKGENYMVVEKLNQNLGSSRKKRPSELECWQEKIYPMIGNKFKLEIMENIMKKNEAMQQVTMNFGNEISSYLNQYKEDVPEWLRNYKEGGQVTFADVMSGRVGYYPGSGFDGTLMKLGNMSHSVHSFLYVDYGISKREIVNHLAQPRSINGYHRIGRIEWKEKDITPNGPYPCNVMKNPLHFDDPKAFVDPKEVPYCFTDIMERNENRDESKGSQRFAITFLFADGIDTYYQIFCREYKKAPWIFLLQDHGFGGNYDCFGKRGILDEIIKKNDIRPRFVLCGDNTDIWDGYKKLNLPAINGGLHYNPRFLYEVK